MTESLPATGSFSPAPNFSKLPEPIKKEIGSLSAPLQRKIFELLSASDLVKVLQVSKGLNQALGEVFWNQMARQLNLKVNENESIEKVKDTVLIHLILQDDESCSKLNNIIIKHFRNIPLLNFEITEQRWNLLSISNLQPPHRATKAMFEVLNSPENYLAKAELIDLIMNMEMPQSERKKLVLLCSYFQLGITFDDIIYRSSDKNRIKILDLFLAKGVFDVSDKLLENDPNLKRLNKKVVSISEISREGRIHIFKELTYKEDETNMRQRQQELEIMVKRLNITPEEASESFKSPPLSDSLSEQAIKQFQAILSSLKQQEPKQESSDNMQTKPKSGVEDVD